MSKFLFNQHTNIREPYAIQSSKNQDKEQNIEKHVKSSVGVCRYKKSYYLASNEFPGKSYAPVYMMRNLLPFQNGVFRDKNSNNNRNRIYDCHMISIRDTELTRRLKQKFSKKMLCFISTNSEVSEELFFVSERGIQDFSDFASKFINRMLIILYRYYIEPYLFCRSKGRSFISRRGASKPNSIFAKLSVASAMFTNSSAEYFENGQHPEDILKTSRDFRKKIPQTSLSLRNMKLKNDSLSHSEQYSNGLEVSSNNSVKNGDIKRSDQELEEVTSSTKPTLENLVFESI
ncbi:hypothetical protein AVEN_48378-1 [Araneus ventricosus]|uniref:Uncharacterized protein n=1 Tax=Araneus ventricosus TaxID=182803 RepID=A0A4Y2AKP2_ARAVE|nr:hypothetical protein AVEN_42463-1 [Araneus ventricosus]GBL80287.1 hypothetical protein AVEN_48378-1 [Araneus ventricosus]